MDGKTLLLMLIGGGLAAYLAYSMVRPQVQGNGENSAPTGDPLSAPPSGDPAFGLGNQDMACRLFPELCPNRFSNRLIW